MSVFREPDRNDDMVRCSTLLNSKHLRGVDLQGVLHVHAHEAHINWPSPVVRNNLVSPIVYKATDS